MNAETFPNDRLANRVKLNSGPKVAERIKRFLIEASILFGGTLFFIQMGWIQDGTEPVTLQLYWIPIILLAMLHGIAGGVVAAIIATMLYLLPDIPQAAFGTSLDAYWSELLRDPALWLLGGTIVGLVRSRQLSQARKVAEQLSLAQNDTILLSEALEASRVRSRAFERRIVSETATVGALLHILPELPVLSARQLFADLLPFLGRCVNAGELRIFIKGSDGLELVARHSKYRGNGAFRVENAGACFGRIQTSPERPLYGLLVARDIESENSREAIEQMLCQFGIDIAEYLDRLGDSENGRRAEKFTRVDDMNSNIDFIDLDDDLCEKSVQRKQ